MGLKFKTIQVEYFNKEIHLMKLLEDTQNDLVEDYFKCWIVEGFVKELYGNPMVLKWFNPILKEKVEGFKLFTTLEGSAIWFIQLFGQDLEDLTVIRHDLYKGQFILEFKISQNLEVATVKFKTQEIKLR